MLFYNIYFFSAQNLGALSANMDNYNYDVPSVSRLCENQQEQNGCNPANLAFDNTIEVNLSFSLLRTLVRLCKNVMLLCSWCSLYRVR